MRSWCWHPPTAMADGCENVTAGCAATCSPSWSIRRFHRITMAASGNCGPPPHTAKSQVASVLSGEPICSLAFDPSLEQQRDEERMRIRLFSQSWTGNLSFSRVEQIPFRPLVLQVDAALQYLQRVGAIGDAEFVRARQPAQRDFARRRLPRPLHRPLPAPVAPGFAGIDQL